MHMLIARFSNLNAHLQTTIKLCAHDSCNLVSVDLGCASKNAVPFTQIPSSIGYFRSFKQLSGINLL
jgi:hypothetical protein